MDNVNKNEEKKNLKSEKFFTQTEKQKKLIEEARKIESRNSSYYHGSFS